MDELVAVPQTSESVGEGVSESPESVESVESSDAPESSEPQAPLSLKERIAKFRDGVDSRKAASEVAELRARLARMESEQGSRYQQLEQKYQQESQQWNDFAGLLRKDPYGALEKLGFTPESVIEKAQYRGTYEGKLEQELGSMRDYIKQQEEYTKGLYEKFKSQEEQRMQAESEYRQSQAKQHLLSLVTDEQYPYSKAEWTDDEYLNEAQGIANQYKELTGENIAPYQFILDSLEERAKFRFDLLETRRGSLRQSKQESAKTKAASASTDGRSSKQLSIGARVASESTGAVKSIDDMTPEEERQYLIDKLKARKQPR